MGGVSDAVRTRANKSQINDLLAVACSSYSADSDLVVVVVVLFCVRKDSLQTAGYWVRRPTEDSPRVQIQKAAVEDLDGYLLLCPNYRQQQQLLPHLPPEVPPCCHHCWGPGEEEEEAVVLLLLLLLL